MNDIAISAATQAMYLTPFLFQSPQAGSTSNNGAGSTSTSQQFFETFVSSNTIYISDLPRNTTYFDIASIFDKIGPCEILIKR